MKVSCLCLQSEARQDDFELLQRTASDRFAIMRVNTGGRLIVTLHVKWAIHDSSDPGMLIYGHDAVAIDGFAKKSMRTPIIILGLPATIAVCLVGSNWFLVSNGQQLAPEKSAPKMVQAPKVPGVGTGAFDRGRASPASVKLMNQKWFWSITDEDSPFGNDDGSDGLAFYREWRKANPNANPIFGV